MNRTTRRVFLQGAGGAAAMAAGLPALSLPTRGAQTGGVRLGFIGVGNQGKNNLKALLKYAVAVCDVDADRLAEAKALVEKENGGTCAAYADYRRLLDDKTIDAVVITTPDHWHALQTIHACEAGKDVYCEKPLTLTVAEGRAMVRAARRYGRVVQTGSQQRSDARFRFACELARGGRLGKVHTVKVGIPGVNFEGPPVPDGPPPPGLDYNAWLGPAPLRPYNVKRVHYNFRFFWDYSGGQMTNWGAHHLDITQWGLGADDSGPISVEGTAEYHPEKWYEVPQRFAVTYAYPGGVSVLCGSEHRQGATFEGDKGWVFVTRGKIEASDPALLLGLDDALKFPRLDHYADWLDSVARRAPPVADVEVGHRSATVCHLGNLAVRVGRKIRWNPERERIVGDPEAAKMLSRPYRAPWRLAAG